MSAVIEDDIVGMNRRALQIPAWLIMQGKELPALCPAATSLSSIRQGEAVSGGAQVEPPGGMKGKDGAVTSTNCIYLYLLFSPLSVSNFPSGLTVTLSVHYKHMQIHPLYPLLPTF